jgi:hypothetical protein
MVGRAVLRPVAVEPAGSHGRVQSHDASALVGEVGQQVERGG